MNNNIPKPCPFCGNHATMKSICGYEYKIGCSKCDVFFCGRTPREALDKWNRRHESTPEAAEPPPQKKPEFADDMLRAQGITTAHCGYCKHFMTHAECDGRMKGWQGHCISSKSTRTAVDADDYCPISRITENDGQGISGGNGCDLRNSFDRFLHDRRTLHSFPGGMEMNHDITHCPNTKCPKASFCRRSTIHFVKFPPPTKWISYAGFSPDPETGVCKHYWPLDTIDLDIQTQQEPGK